MKRREFMAASCLATLAPLGAAAQAKGTANDPDKEYLELRLYRVGSADQGKRLDDFLRDAAIPALNRIGIKPVGVFKMMKEQDRDLYVLLPHKSVESFATAHRRLMADGEFLKAGAAFLDLPRSDRGYQRIESSLMVAFDGVPKLIAPPRKASRVFQLRTYESHSARKALKKIEMFNTGGELAIFHRCGMQPVFFGETLAGAKMPNLTYMLVFDDMDASKANWAKFIADPAWKKLSRDPAYKDTVSHITNTFLRPAAYSQV